MSAPSTAPLRSAWTYLHATVHDSVAKSLSRAAIVAGTDSSSSASSSPVFMLGIIAGALPARHKDVPRV